MSRLPVRLLLVHTIINVRFIRSLQVIIGRHATVDSRFAVRLLPESFRVFVQSSFPGVHPTPVLLPALASQPYKAPVPQDPIGSHGCYCVVLARRLPQQVVTTFLVTALVGATKLPPAATFCPVPALQPLTYCEEEEEQPKQHCALLPPQKIIYPLPPPPFQVPPGQAFDDQSPSHLAGGQSRPWRHSPHCMRRGVLGFVGESGGRMAGRRGDEAAAARVNEIPASTFPPDETIF
jgi:hypothetical protein